MPNMLLNFLCLNLEPAKDLKFYFHSVYLMTKEQIYNSLIETIPKYLFHSLTKQVFPILTKT